MGLFKSKAQKEQERKMAVRRSMKELEKRIQKLEEQKKVYIDSVKIAEREGLPDEVKFARNALRMTESERKRTYQMLLRARVMSQMKDMSAMTNEFLEAIHTISKDIVGMTTTDMSKITGELRMAMDKVSEQTENLEELIEDSQDSVSAFSDESSLVTDADIDKLIYGSDGGANSAVDIDADIERLRKQLGS